jgi:hypothetical protein
VIDRKEIPLYKHAFNNNHSAGKQHPIPFNEGFFENSSYTGFVTWQTMGDKGHLSVTKGSNQYPVVITPTFKSGSNAPLISDAIVIRQYLTLHKEDFAKLTKISFDFWDPRANTKAQHKNRGNGRTAGSRGR